MQRSQTAANFGILFDAIDLILGDGNGSTV